MGCMYVYMYMFELQDKRFMCLVYSDRLRQMFYVNGLGKLSIIIGTPHKRKTLKKIIL